MSDLRAIRGSVVVDMERFQGHHGNRQVSVLGRLNRPMGDDAGQWVELRVHGVSGTPPEALLARPHVKQVAGDAFSRFFRPVGDDDRPLYADDGHIVEGYHWGQFTSGSWRAGLWLILVPFGLINAAQFMLPGFIDRKSKILHGICGALLRLLALLLTCLLTFTSGFVLMDLIGWRWAARARMLRNFEPSTVLSAAVVLSALAMVFLFLLGRGFGITGQRQSAGAESMAKTPLALEAFYRGDADASTLRRLHLVAGLSLVALMAMLARDAEAWTNRPLIGVLAFILLMATVIVVTCLGDPEGSVSVDMSSSLDRFRDTWHRLVRHSSHVLVGGAVLLVAASAIAMKDSTRPDKGVGRIDAFDGISNALLLVGVIAISVLFIACVALAWMTRSTERDPEAPERFFARYAWGMTAFLVTSVSASVGVGLSAGVATAVSSSLNLDVAEVVDATGATLRTRVGATPILDRVAYAWGLTALMLMAIAIVAIGQFLVRRKHCRAAALSMSRQPAATTSELPSGWISPIARAMWIARLKTQLPKLFWLFAAFGVVLSLAHAWEVGPCGGGENPVLCKSAPGVLDLLSQPRISGNGDFLTIFGAWTLLGLAAAMVTLSRGAIKTQSSRRGVNVIWDVISFWPHAVHPFVPRPYSQRTVVDLRDRIRWHLANCGETGVQRPVVVCGHSQGSLISFAALLLLTQEERDRVALVTFGSQLRLIFPRAFPAFVNVETIADLYSSLNGAWINLYRATDPLAGPVLSWDHTPDGENPMSQHFPDPDAGRRPDSYDSTTRRRISGADWRLIDPTPYDRELQTGPVTRLYGHSDFWSDPDWSTALQEVVDVVRETPTT